MHHAGAIDNMAHLHLILVNNYLTIENAGVKYVAWNGNNFDSFILAASLLVNDDYLIRPYLTKSKALRGLRVETKTPPDDWKGKKPPSWEFLDGMAMLGLAGLSLEKFLINFATDFAKLTGVIDFEKGETFDATNPTHRDYAMRDSVGLYHAMIRAQDILIENFNQALSVTMGGACIRIFQSHIPTETNIIPNRPEVDDLIRSYVMRGGFCYCVRQFRGPVWKYDINQAYASAMREAKLPCEFATHCSFGVTKAAQVYIARVSAINSKNKIPFYYRTEIRGRLRSVFSVGEIADTWLTSIELEQLKIEGWKITYHESWIWNNSFSMTEYVDRLETVRTTCEGGPSGPIGTVIKAVGNHSYGKTVEVLEPVEFVIAKTCPPEYAPYYADDTDLLEHVFKRYLPLDEQKAKDYHQPHIGAFITAHVRMALRRATLISPDTWLYADTDCVVFSSDVTARLDVDPKRYGAWKIEESGTVYQIIAKKVYTQIGGEKPKRSAKGMNVRRLTDEDFERWADGDLPVQSQIQRNNFIKVMRGEDMFKLQQRTGTATEKSEAKNPLKERQRRQERVKKIVEKSA